MLIIPLSPFHYLWNFNTSMSFSCNCCCSYKRQQLITAMYQNKYRRYIRVFVHIQFLHCTLIITVPNARSRANYYIVKCYSPTTNTATILSQMLRLSGIQDSSNRMYKSLQIHTGVYIQKSLMSFLRLDIYSTFIAFSSFVYYLLA